MKIIIFNLFFLMIAFTISAQNYDVRFKRGTLNCNTQQVCYDVQMRPNAGASFNLAGQNYRIFYNSSVQSFVSGTSLLPGQYTGFTLVQDVQNLDGSGVGGPLSFEGTLGFLNYFMDLTDVQNGGVNFPTDGSWLSTSNICFTVTPEALNDPNVCLEMVWGRAGLTDLYATAFVEVSRWVKSNVTTGSVGVIYEDLNSSNGDAACFTSSCANNPISVTSFSVNESAGNAEVQVCTPIANTQDVTVRLSTSNGTAVAPGDYTAQSNVLVTIPAGQTCATVNIPIINDPTPEDNEVFTITLSSPSTNAVLGQATSTVTILDDDGATPNYDVRFKKGTIDCDTRQVCYDVQIRPNAGANFNLAGQNYRIFYNSANQSYISGTSLLPGEYTPYTLVQDLQNLDASATNGQLSFEGTLGFLNYYMDLTDIQNGGIVLPTNGTWYSTSNICFTVTPEVLSDPNTCLEMVWGRTGLTDPYATAFVEVARWVSPNYTTNSSGVLYDDLNSADGEDACFNTSCSQVDISVTNITVNESDGNAALQVCISNTSTSDVTVTLNTSNGTAFAPGDYTTQTNILVTIPAGQTCATVNIPIIDDNVAESTETFNVILSNPSSNATINNNTGTVTILDNDSSCAAKAPTISG